jgi:hypothetical protein
MPKIVMVFHNHRVVRQNRGPPAAVSAVRCIPPTALCGASDGPALARALGQSGPLSTVVQRSGVYAPTVLSEQEIGGDTNHVSPGGGLLAWQYSASCIAAVSFLLKTGIFSKSRTSTSLT